jgi:hypothetical protein
MSARLPAHLEVASLIRLAQAQGGMATVLAKGERDAGTVLVAIMRRGEKGALYERMPDLDGSRRFTLTRTQDETEPGAFGDYLDRRRRQDPDIWILEVDMDDPQEFLSLLPD